MVMMRLSVFAGRQRSKRSLFKKPAALAGVAAAAPDAEPAPEEEEEEYGFTPQDYLELIPDMNETELRDALSEIGKPPDADVTEESMSAELEKYYKSKIKGGGGAATAAADADALNPDSPWVEYMDEAKGIPYFYNTDNEAVTWTRPPEGNSHLGCPARGFCSVHCAQTC